ncbi:mitochondrial carrier domain-containing protein [Suillus variegatus]|nr:mitochondrial carrier domain-containing protein [Suillus variegatus]
MSHLAPTGKWDARYIGPVPHDATYYAKCMLGGVLACGITHAGITPLDVAKCNMQGQTGIWKGFGPTFVGYSYGLYEVFKDHCTNKYKPAIWLAGSASAEIFADIALCPLEMTKVKIQTSPSGTFPTSFGAALAEMSRTKAETRYPFGSLVPLWSRQIPYTMAKFLFYEKIVQLFYTHVFTEPKETYAKTTQLGVTFASGYLAGVVCAVVSHPADTVVSLMGKPANKGKSIGTIASETGIVTLATKGLGARVLMIGTLTGFQWWIYDSFKASMGLGTTGGK